MSKNLLKALALALWLWLPSLAVLATDQLQSAADAVALLGLSAFILAGPFVLIPRPRYAFLLLTPLALVAGPYCFLTFFYHSVPSDALLLSVWQTNWAESSEVLGSFGWLPWLVPATTLIYAGLAWSLPRDWRTGWEGRKRAAAALLMLAMLAIGGRTFFPHSLKMPPFFEYSTTNLAFPGNLAWSTWRITHHLGNQAPFVSVGGSYRDGEQPLLVVLVIGESLRTDHLGLNGYQRDTTPALSGLGAELLSFKDVVSTANCTSLAVPTIVTAPVGDKQASLVQTFHEAGFRTAWISNHRDRELATAADLVEYADNSQDYHMRRDEQLLPLATSFNQQAGPRQFIVLHMMGSHIDYDERYGPDSRVFRPTLSDQGVDFPRQQDKVAAINSYDNTVLETDRLLARIIGIVRKETRPAVMLFVSDHGENLFDDQRGLFMHTQSPPTTYDLRVPALVWMNQPYRQRFPQRVAALQDNRNTPISHMHMFPTLLELGSVAWQGADPRSSFAGRQFVGGERRVYINAREMDNFEKVK